MSGLGGPIDRRRAASGRGQRAARLSVGEYALLGMLAVAPESETGVHGYDLSKRLHDGPLAEIIRIESGMLYHYLKKLAKAELITTVVERQANRPDRQDHQLTVTGRAMLMTWLREPVRATRDIRLDFLVKLSFARELSPDLATDLVHAQQAVIAQLVTSLQQQLDAIGAEAGDDVIRRTVLELRLAQTGAVRAWLEALHEFADA